MFRMGGKLVLVEAVHPAVAVAGKCRNGTALASARVADKSRNGTPLARMRRGLHILRSIEEVRALRHDLMVRNQTVGFVPTMGALHQGHMSLVEEAKLQCDKVVASIFVNPAQFAPHEDLDAYPRPLDDDLAKLKASGTYAVYVPEAATLYGPDGAPPAGVPLEPEDAEPGRLRETCVVIPGADSVGEGSARPGFFRGVATIVVKLLNIVQPTKFFIGQKDGMQCIVLRKMVADLHMDTEAVVCPTLREPDGLALSSRNVYLNGDDRMAAPALFNGLKAADDLFRGGNRDVNLLCAAVNLHLYTPGLSPEYAYVCSARDGRRITQGDAGDDCMLAVAARAKMSRTRLIDNHLLGTPFDLSTACELAPSLTEERVV